MEPIKVDTSILKSRIESEAKNCIDVISSNAKKGINVTELYVSLDIHSDIRSHITSELKKSGTNFDFLIVDRRPNEFTGKMMSFSGKTVGQERYWKVKIY